MFQGYDSITSNFLGEAVTGTVDDRGSAGSSQYTVCTSIESLTTALSISASLSGAFGFGTMSAKTEFVSTLNVSTTSVCIVVYATSSTAQAYNDVRFVASPTGDMDAYFAAYGDSWVNACTIGGEYIAVYTFYAQSTSEQETITAAFSAQGIGTSGSLDIDTQTKIDTARQSVSTKQSLRQYMSGYTAPDFPSASGIVDFATAFPATPFDSPRVTTFSTLGYEHVGYRASFEEIIATRTLYLGDDGLGGLAGVYQTLSGVANAIATIQTTYAAYGYSIDTVLTDNAAVVANGKAALVSLFNDMEARPTATHTAPTLPATAIGAPAIQYSVSNIDLGGAYGGQPFNDVGANAVDGNVTIATVAFRGGDVVDQISTVYSSSQSPAVHGGDGGSASPTFVLGAAEYITQIWGAYGNDVNFVCLRTNLGNTMSWPPSPEGAGSYFYWKATPGYALLGFGGRSGDLLDHLSISVVQFTPATWA
jgi:hypothetical protein